MSARAFLLIALAALAACSRDDGDRDVASEQLVERPWRETLEVTGELRAAKSTPLLVPGGNWEPRTLVEVAPEGALLRKGELVARFDAAKARVELDQTEIDLMRNALAQAGQDVTTGVARAQLGTDLAQVDAALSLSQRYAEADALAFARHQILDALQDVGFLRDKRGYLGWRRGQTEQRGAADRAVIDSQRETFSTQAERRRGSLAALEIRAPHDGVLVLDTRWDGTRPQVGGNLWAGDDFASLPDLEALVARFHVAQTQASLLALGQAARIRLAGTGVEFDARITKVGGSATVRSRESPVKYIELEAAVPAAAVTAHALRPGQAVRASVVLVERERALTVPNIALDSRDGTYAVTLADGTRVDVELGARGAARSEIAKGLAAGARVLLSPTPDAEP